VDVPSPRKGKGRQRELDATGQGDHSPTKEQQTMSNGNQPEQANATGTPPLTEFRTTMESRVVRREAKEGLTFEDYLIGERDPEPGEDKVIWAGTSVAAVLRAANSEYVDRAPDLFRFDGGGRYGGLNDKGEGPGVKAEPDLPPFEVFVKQELQHHTGRWNDSLDRVIADELEDVNEHSPNTTRTIWRGEKCLVAINIDADLRCEVIRLDCPPDRMVRLGCKSLAMPSTHYARHKNITREQAEALAERQEATGDYSEEPAERAQAGV
jgi:hypothetical protein